MRYALVLLASLGAPLATLCPAQPAADAQGTVLQATKQTASVRFVRVWPQCFDEDSFRTISEYRGGKESTGGWIELRSSPDSRGGLYFTTRVQNAGPAEVSARFVASVVAPDSPDAKIFRFPALIPRGSQVFQIGITGKDWKGSQIHPVAWKLELIAGDGRVLASKASFLWEKK